MNRRRSHRNDALVDGGLAVHAPGLGSADVTDGFPKRAGGYLAGYAGAVTGVAGALGRRRGRWRLSLCTWWLAGAFGHRTQGGWSGRHLCTVDGSGGCRLWLARQHLPGPCKKLAPLFLASVLVFVGGAERSEERRVGE